jgi:hypothetical protein
MPERVWNGYARLHTTYHSCDCHKKGIVNFVNFASSKCEFLGDSEYTFTVCGNDDRVFIPTEDNNSSGRLVIKTIRAKYVKETDTGWFWGDKFERVACKDIDISEDGEHWYHLLGSYCLYGYSELKIIYESDNKNEQ